MSEEGNNCVFLSKYIKNVAIRWNKDFHILKFVAMSSKREVPKKKNSEEQPIMSEIIVEAILGMDKEIVKIQIEKEKLINLLKMRGDNFTA
jgi:hypothetical protein